MMLNFSDEVADLDYYYDAMRDERDDVTQQGERDTYLEWLMTLKEGDEVATTRRIRRGHDLSRVARITKRHIFLTSGAKYRRDTGSRIGVDEWSSTDLVQPTDRIRSWARQERLARGLQAERWDLYPLELLEQINTLITQHAKAVGGE